MKINDFADVPKTNPNKPNLKADPYYLKVAVGRTILPVGSQNPIFTAKKHLAHNPNRF
jgi:hypothetical protein